MTLRVDGGGWKNEWFRRDGHWVVQLNWEKRPIWNDYYDDYGERRQNWNMAVGVYKLAIDDDDDDDE